MQTFIEALKDICFVLDDESKTDYALDWTRFYTPSLLAVAFPTSTNEVSAVLRLCHQHSVALVPSGGRSGLAGGACATKDELVLSLVRMNKILESDLVGATQRVQAGVVTEALHDHLAEHNLTWPIDLAAKGSSTIGGNISTNAGGVRVIRYGQTREWVLSLTVVLADGRILELGGALEKNNTGFDLKQLFIGGEGTLGVVCEATLKLAPLPKNAHVAFFKCDSLKSVLSLFALTRKHALTLNAFETLSQPCFAEVCRVQKKATPFSSSTPDDAYFALIECDETLDIFSSFLEDALRNEGVLEGVLAQNHTQKKSLWAFRESITESLSHRKVVNKDDIAVPIKNICDFESALHHMFRKQFSKHELFVFGHIGDGNLHVNVPKPATMSAEEFENDRAQIDDGIFSLVARFKGSISAEHGIGLLKKEHLHHSRSDDEIQIFKQVKRLFDPKNLMNPGKLIDL